MSIATLKGSLASEVVGFDKPNKICCCWHLYCTLNKGGLCVSLVNSLFPRTMQQCSCVIYGSLNVRAVKLVAYLLSSLLSARILFFSCSLLVPLFSMANISESNSGQEQPRPGLLSCFIILVLSTADTFPQCGKESQIIVSLQQLVKMLIISSRLVVS